MGEIIIGNKYKLLNQIGEGSFGKIFEAEHILTNDKVAIKIEKKDVKNVLKHEANIYYKCKNIRGIPSIRMFGTESNYNYIVMDLLNVSLEQLRENNNGTISLLDLLPMSIQLINCLEKLHGIGIIHRDLKPENVMTSTRENIVYLIDFGIARYYINQNRDHIPITYNKKLIGNVRYASLNIHNGIEPSRRDDLISLGYIFILCLKGKLPWQNIKSDADKDEKYNIIKQIKESTSLIDLCSGVPYEFLSYMNYCSYLEFNEEPNYDYIKTLFMNLLKLSKSNNSIKY